MDDMKDVVVTYTPEAEAVYVSLRSRRPGDVARTQPWDESRNVDYGGGGEVLGVEFLNVSAGIDLAGLPEQQTLTAALRSFPSLAAA
ncbi:MAG: DUF2283 domain-containing protein [Dehalococcoidia bacterium]